MSDLYQQIGRKIGEVRREQGMRQNDLADAVSLTRASVANIERGRQRFLLHRLFEIADALGVPVVVLLPDDGVPDQDVKDSDAKMPDGIELSEKNRSLIESLVMHKKKAR